MIVDRYYYNQLNKKEQTIYKAFYQGVMAHQAVIPLPIKGNLPEDMFDRIFRAITRDNPLIYFLNQSACSYAEDGRGHTAICPQYFFDEAKIRKYNKKIQDTVNELAGKLQLTQGTEYEKELKVHDWICSYISYDNQGADMSNPARVMASHNIIGVLANHTAQCEGIAKAVKVLLNAVDVKCIVVTGEATENSNTAPHAWNIVSLDNKSYQMDMTWDIGTVGKSKNRISYDYFNITEAMMAKDHKQDGKLPVCDSTDMNYFTKNKLNFKSKTMLMAYLGTAVNKGQEDFYLRLEGRIATSKTVNEMTAFVKNAFMEKGQCGVRIQQAFNEKVGSCWIRIL
jgi:hypothetical protein